MSDSELPGQSNLELLRAELPPRYQQLKPLAVGGMGLLFTAFDVEKSRPVAIKMLRPNLPGEDPAETKKRFIREARAISRLSHPYIVQVYEVEAGKELPYFVMELVQGETLGTYLGRTKLVDLQRHLRITLDICDALSHAHQKGIIHRDVKPENVVLLPQGGVKLLDFGLAKSTDGSLLTKTGQVMGTPVYMSPEQLQGEPIDQRADLYSLGVICYQLVTLGLPFHQDQFYSKIYRPPDPPSVKNPAVSPSLDAVILRALSVQPALRQDSADDLKWELSACLKDYADFRDIALMGEDWKDLLQSDLEKLSVEATRIRERIVLTEGEIREVTLLVLRLRGLADRSDVIAREGIEFVQDRTFRILGNEVERYGGCVDRYEPHGLVAHFGSRSATEADCDRAVLAGLGVFEKVRAVNGMLSPRGITLEAGIGVDVARITVGREEKVDSGSFPIMRPPLPDLLGGLWVTETVRRRIAEGFQIENGPMYHRVVEAVPVRATGERRPGGFMRTPFVGRVLQIGDLVSFYGEAARTVNPGPGTTLGYRRSKPTIVSLRGEAGIGKSRLIHEFVSVQQAKGCSLALQSSTISFLKSPFYLVTGLLRRWLGVTESTPGALVRDLLAERIKQLEVLALGRRSLGNLREPLDYLLGLPQGSKPPMRFPAPVEDRPPSIPSIQLSIVQAACDLVLMIAMDTVGREGQPQTVVLEDIQWIDDLSLSVVEALLTSADAGLFVIMTHRPPYEPPERWKRFSSFHALPLGPLDPQESRKLVASMLDGQEPGGKLMDLIVRRSGGNPYFLEETVNLLVDERALVPNEKGWEVCVPEESLSVPGTIQALVLSRFDLLPREEKELLQVCSVIGIDVDGAILEEMARELRGDGHDIRRFLSRLEEMQFLNFREVQGRFAYSFRHWLAREVVYSTILASNRRILHGLAARTIEKLFIGTLDEQSALLAYHCNRSDEPGRALQYTEIALRKSVAKYDHEGTLKLAAEALKLLALIGEDPARRFDVLAMRERALEVTGQREEQRRDLTEMLDRAKVISDERRISDAQNRLSWFYWWNVGDYAKAHQLAVVALETKRKLKDRHGEAESFRNLGCVNSLLGNFEEALRAHKRAQRLYEESGDTVGVAASVCSLAITMGTMGQIAEALTKAEEALEIDRRTGDRRGVGRELRTMGDLHRSVGDDEKAIEYYTQALSNDRDIGYRQGEAANLACSGTAFLNQGRAEEALIRFKDAMEAALAIDYRPLVGEVFLGMAVAYRERGEVSGWEVARVCAQNARDLGEELGIAGLTVMGTTSLAFSHLLLGRIEEAERLSNRAVSFLRGVGFANVRPEEVWFNHSLVLNKAGKPDEARSSLERASNMVTERASRIADEKLRHGFLSRVALNQRIMVGWKHAKKP